MNIIAKNITYGIDKIIKSIQVHLDNKLKWSGDIDCYGRLERTDTDTGSKYEYYINGREYREVFVDDRKDAVIGFVVLPTRSVDGFNVTATVDVITTAKIDNILVGSNRATEKVINDMRKALHSAPYTIEVVEVRETISEVFSGVTIDLMKYRDMQPFYVFAIRINIIYNEDDC